VNADYDTRNFSCDGCRHYIPDEYEAKKNIAGYFKAAWAIISGENPLVSNFRLEKSPNMPNGRDNSAENSKRYRERKKLKELSHDQTLRVVQSVGRTD
jgi:hypothetical protein